MTVQSTTYVAGEATVLKVRGRIEGHDLQSWVNALEAAGLVGRGPIVVDLEGVDHWSIAAQGILLVAARSAARRGRRLFLCRPPEVLRAATKALRVFDRLPTYRDAEAAAKDLRLPGGWTEPPSARSRATRETLGA
jgi:anti-anti-sigma factor